MTKKILLVEDNGLFRKTVRRIIRNRFPELEIDEAGNVRESRAKVVTFMPDVIFMDIRLPDGDGLRLTQLVKADFPETIVIMLTNLDSAEYRDASVEAGADAFISKKSATLEMIVDVLDMIVKQRHPSREPDSIRK